LSKALIKDPSKRPTAKQLLEHPWLSMFDDAQKIPDDQMRKSLAAVSQNLQWFCFTSNFGQTVISILSGLKVQ